MKSSYSLIFGIDPDHLFGSFDKEFQFHGLTNENPVSTIAL
ncbi:MAG TPA: hypothetical protein VJT15_14520 [Pyrinomonadaceae bacterium]|nr:hypothetical protein [Pyrinomonadaceae bacterium]